MCVRAYRDFFEVVITLSQAFKKMECKKHE